MPLIAPRVSGNRFADKLETKRVAGRIVPAIATTTAVVAGLSCLELVKMATRRRHRTEANHGALSSPPSDGPGSASLALGVHRNAFLNLALPLFAFSDLVPAAALPFGNRGLDDDDVGGDSGGGDVEKAAARPRALTFTVWDCIDLRPRRGPAGAARDLTLAEVIGGVEATAGPGAVVRSVAHEVRVRKHFLGERPSPPSRERCHHHASPMLER
jgi:hypothetical protein